MRFSFFIAATTLVLVGMSNNTAAAPLALKSISSAYRGSLPPEILPTPREATFPDGVLAYAGLGLKIIGNEKELQWAARDFKDELANRGLPALNGNTKNIRIGTIADGELKDVLAGKTLDNEEAYAIVVNKDSANLIGKTALGAYRGMQTLRQLITSEGLRFAEIRDWPQLQWRGAMIYLDKNSKPTNDILIPLLAKLKFNQVLVMCDYVRWNASKTIWHPNGASSEEAQRIANMIRDYGMEPIPLIETLSHTAWMFYNPQTNAPNANKDWWQDPDASTPYAYDTLNENVYKFLLPVLTEAIDIFKPKYLHIGHDEIKSVNRFPGRENGKAIGFEKLFVDDTLKLYNHLKSQNVGTIIWHDTAMNNAYKEKLAPELPKDILVIDWNYNPLPEYTSPRNSQSAGFGVIGASWLSAGNAENYAKSILQLKGLGMLQTRWTGYFGNSTMNDGQADQGAAYVRAGQSFWNPENKTVLDSASRYRDAWSPIALVDVPGKLVDLSAVATRKLTDTDETQWIRKGAGTDLSSFPSGETQIAGYRFLVGDAAMLRGTRPGARELPESINLEINAKAAAIAFLQTTGWLANQYRTKVGAYTIKFDDGSNVVVPLEYGKNISSWADTSIKSVYLDPVWHGKTKDGLEVGVNVFVWTNPNPTKNIVGIEMKSEGLDANPTLLGLSLFDQTIEVPKL